jgi:hypothetical protein
MNGLLHCIVAVPVDHSLPERSRGEIASEKNDLEHKRELISRARIEPE